jgi:UDP-N-acetylmuramate dehydrogenase
MLLDEGDPDSRSAGSFFKNPIVPAATVSRLAVIAGCRVDEVPQFPPGSWVAPADELVKISAAWLIERTGFHKGFRMGQAGISTKHTLALVNLGGASAAEIVALRDAVMHAVEARFAIRLEQEPVTLGFAHPH